ncbi:MAG: hypothetical protein J6Z46_06495 [Lachnospiraceae bacterium]|nr:hypothetical protein [Lachnospiraceae bacterium]
MYCKTITCARSGNETILLSVEADIRNGLPGFTVCGAVSQEMKESKERVRIALENAGFLMPPKRITVNLSPETKKNDRSSPDLAIALSVLSAYGYIPESFLNDIAVIGDLSLDGGVKPVKGVFSYACEAERSGIKRIIVPFENAAEAAICESLTVYGVSSVKEAVFSLNGEKEPYKRDEKVTEALLSEDRPEIDLNDVPYALNSRKALYYAARAHMNVLLFGADEACKKLCEAFGNHVSEISKEEKIKYLKLKNTPEIMENKDIEVHNGYVVIRSAMNSKKTDLRALYRALPRGCVTIACASPCPCGAYPDRSCVCTVSKLKSHYAKLDRAVLENTGIFTHIGYGLSDILSVRESGTFFKRHDEIDEVENENDGTPADTPLSEENKRTLGRLFAGRPFSEREVMNTIKLAKVIARTEKSEVSPKHMEEAFSYCVFSFEKRAADEE